MKLEQEDLTKVYKNCVDKYPEEEDFFSEQLNDFIHLNNGILSEDVCRGILNQTGTSKEVAKKLVLELITIAEKNIKKDNELFCDDFRALRKIDRLCNVPKAGGPVECPYCGETHNDI